MHTLSDCTMLISISVNCTYGRHIYVLFVSGSIADAAIGLRYIERTLLL